MTCLKREKKHFLHVVLAFLLCTAVMVSIAVPAKAFGLSGDWEKVKINDLTTYALVLDSTLIDVSSFDLGIDVEMKAGARCEKWNVWVRRSRGGSFEKVDNIYLDGGNGAASKTICFTRAQNVNAVAITPVASGSFSWSFSLEVSNPVYGSKTNDSSPSKHLTSGGETLPGDWEAVKIEKYNVHALVLDTKLYDVTSFYLDVNVEMKAGAHCENWDVWARSSRNGSFRKIGYVYLEDGFGAASKTIRLSEAMNIDAVTLTPQASGSFSWTLYMTLSNPAYAANDSGSGDGGNYLSGDWEKVSIVDNGREYNVHAFVPTGGMYCRQFDLYVDIDMRANTKCYNWHVWVHRNGVFEQVGEIYLPSGRGSASETIKLGSLRRNVDAVALIPTASGGYTWGISMGISNLE